MLILQLKSINLNVNLFANYTSQTFNYCRWVFCVLKHANVVPTHKKKKEENEKKNKFQTGQYPPQLKRILENLLVNDSWKLLNLFFN